ncbi:MAG TPA: PDZ domain-containing protein [Sphingobacteriaceae bacterium]
MKSFKKYNLIFIAVMTLYSAAASSQNISYTISFPQPQTHYIDVEMAISGINKDYVDLKMPVWTPGSYLIREFAKNVEEFKASDLNGKPLAFHKINKNTWRITSKNTSKIKIDYQVYAFEISVRTSFVDDSHGFLSPAGVFMFPDGQLNQPSTILIKPFKNWDKISTGLEPVKGKPNTFYAPDFDILYDSPIEVGNQDVFGFTAAGVKHEIAMSGGGNYDKTALKTDMAKIVEEATSIFKENPNKRYVFIVHNYHSGGGGLEHLNSTVLGATRNGYTNPSKYKGFLGLVAHEYFHLWNVKRLRPEALGPFDYEKENYTSALWISEGFTAYYDNLIMRRAGLYTPEQYLEVLVNDINVVSNQPGSRIQSVAEASFDAWIKYYRPNENSANSTISYYNKGALLGMIIDLEIMNATKGAKGLDDVMKQMYDLYYKKLNRGFTDAEFKAMVEKVAGKSFDDIYSDYVNGVNPIDYKKYLGYAGLQPVDEYDGKSEPYLGVATAVKDGKTIVTSVARNSAAWLVGINVNDELLSVNGSRISPGTDPKVSELSKFISSAKVGDKLKIELVRDGLVKNLEVRLLKNPSVKYKIEPVEGASEMQLKIRKKWLKL